MSPNTHALENCKILVKFLQPQAAGDGWLYY